MWIARTRTRTCSGGRATCGSSITARRFTGTTTGTDPPPAAIDIDLSSTFNIGDDALKPSPHDSTPSLIERPSRHLALGERWQAHGVQRHDDEVTAIARIDSYSLPDGEAEQWITHPAILDLAGPYADLVGGSAPLRAIAVPRITGRLRVDHATSGTVIRAMAPSTVFGLFGATEGTLPLLARLASGVPGFVLELGDDAGEVANAVAALTDTA